MINAKDARAIKQAEAVTVADTIRTASVTAAVAAAVGLALAGLPAPRALAADADAGVLQMTGKSQDTGKAGAAGADAPNPPRYTGTLQHAGRQSVPLPSALAEGDFVQGALHGRAMRLVLLDRSGDRVRILAKGLQEQQEFMFIAGDRGPYALEVRAPQGGAYTLALERMVPRAAQAAPRQVIDSPRLRALRQTLKNGGGSDGFWREMAAAGTPLIELETNAASTSTSDRAGPATDRRQLVTFLWRGAKHNVLILGAPSSDHDPMARLDDSDVWYRSYRIPADSVLTYRLAPDVPELDADAGTRRRAILATAQRDPLNPRSFPERPLDRYDGESVLEPAADTDWQAARHWLQPLPGAAHGSVEKLRYASTALGNERDIFLYRPHGYRPAARGNALVVFFDAEAWLTKVPTATILDNLIAAGKLPSTAAILIGNPGTDARAAELPPNPAFQTFLADELMPWARSRGIAADPSLTVIAGASYGGLAAAYSGFVHAELFGNVLSQSGSFWWPRQDPEWLTRQFAESPRRPLTFRLEAGLFETGRADSAGIRDTSRHLRDVLRAKGYRVDYRDYASGHDHYRWRSSLADGLISLIGIDRAPAAPAHSD